MLPARVAAEIDRLWEEGEEPAQLACIGVAPGLEAPQPILTLAAFHPVLEVLTRARGQDPDRSLRLTKVTQTR